MRQKLTDKREIQWNKTLFYLANITNFNFLEISEIENFEISRQLFPIFQWRHFVVTEVREYWTRDEHWFEDFEAHIFSVTTFLLFVIFATSTSDSSINLQSWFWFLPWKFHTSFEFEPTPFRLPGEFVDHYATEVVFIWLSHIMSDRILRILQLELPA